jgi:hypothetical protein
LKFKEIVNRLTGFSTPVFGVSWNPPQMHIADSWIFNSALAELRGVIGIHIAALAAQHGLDIEDGLATILQATDD